MISLDEQIAYAEQWYTGNETTDSILLSLRRLKRIEELMREPSEEMMRVYQTAFTSKARFDGKNVYKAMSAALLKQVEEEVK